MKATGLLSTALVPSAGRLARLPRVRKIALWAGGAVALYAVAGFLVAPPIVRSQLERVLGEQLGRQVTIERVRINPFALSASIHNFSLKERDGSTNAASFEDLQVNVTLSSLFRLGLVVEAARLSKPDVRLVRYDDRKYNFQDIVDRFASAPSGPPGASPRFAVYNITVADGRIEFDDRPQKTRHTVTDIQLGLPFVSSLPRQVDIMVQPRLSLKANGTPFEITGETKPFKDTRETTVRIDIDDLELAKYLEYSPIPLRVRVPSGRLDTRLVLSLSAAPDDRLQTLNLSGSASLQDLKVQQADGAPLAAIGRLSVDLDSVDLLKQRAMIKTVRIEAPEVDIRRFKDGRLNLLAAVPATPAEGPTDSSEPPFTFSVAEIALANGKARLVDLSTEKPARFALHNVSLNVSALGNAPGTKAAVRLGFNTELKGGGLTYDGSLQLVPLRTEGRLNLASFRFNVLAPYIEQVLNVVIAGGTFSTKGRLSVEVPDGQPVRIAYRGDASIANFASLDKAASQDLLRWKSLAVKGIDVGTDPLKVAVGEVALSDFYSRLIVDADGKLNLQGLLKQTGASGGKPAAAPPTADTPGGSPPPNIRLGKIVLRGGSVNYSDSFVKPNYTVMLTGVEGGVTEMTPEKAGDVQLRGRIHETAPVEIAGKVNALGKDLFVDLKASARDIDLSPLSPYSVKYAGYGIEKGKLSVKLAYLIENRKLVAENNIYLDQLTFGEKVDSPTATHLPVLLAVSLLKDKNGVINVNVPISGTLDDPQFSVGGVITQVIGNLIVRTVTEPFAFLGSLFGGGKELAFLEFAPGSAKLDADGETKLKTLAKALDERPGLKLDVSGRIDPDADRDGLKRAWVDRQIKTAKVQDIGKKAVDEASLDEVAIEPTEREKYLAVAYRAAKFQRPQNAIGLLKDLPAPEMEKLMLANAPVTDGELRQLADFRAQVAKDWLVETGKVPAGRVFIAAPKMSAEGIKDQGKPSRVDFSLR